MKLRESVHISDALLGGERDGPRADECLQSRREKVRAQRLEHSKRLCYHTHHAFDLRWPSPSPETDFLSP